MYKLVLSPAHCRQHEDYLRHRRKIDAAALRFKARNPASLPSWPSPLTKREKERIVQELSGQLEPVFRFCIAETDPTVGSIQLCVAGYYRKSLQEMLSHRRTKALVMPRMVSMYLSKKLTTHSLPEIGRRYNDRDHTTVLFAVRKIAQLVGDSSITQHPRTKPVAVDGTLCKDIELIRCALGQ